MDAKIRKRIRERSHGVCERCRSRPATVIHHRLRRSHGGSDDEDNLMHLCSPCHSGIHDHPADSYRDGYLIRGVQNVQKGLGYRHVETDG